MNTVASTAPKQQPVPKKPSKPRSTLFKKITTVSGTATTVLGTIILIWGALSTSRTEFILPTLESPPPSPPIYKETLVFQVPVSGYEDQKDNLQAMLADVAAVELAEVRIEFGSNIVAFIDVPSREIADVNADLTRTATNRLNVCCGISSSSSSVVIAAPPSTPSI